jgi:hypothetical protein
MDTPRVGDTSSKYAVPLADLEGVKVPVELQVEEQDVPEDHDYLTAVELDRLPLLSPTGAGRVRIT